MNAPDRGREAEAAQDRRGACRRRMRVDVDQPGLDLRDPVRVMGGVRFPQQGIALQIGLQHDLDQALRAIRGLLCKTADPPARRQRDCARLDRQVAADRIEQRRFACAVAADEADPGAGTDLHGGVVDQLPAGNPERNVGD